MKPIVYSSPYIPPEWIAAHGFAPVRLIPGPGPQGPVRPMQGVCPFMRLFVNEAASLPDVAGIVLATVCDPMRHAKDVLDRETDIPSFLFNVPSLWKIPAAHALYRSEILRLGRFLLALGGRAPSHTEWVGFMDRYDQQRNQNHPETQPHVAGKPVAVLGGPLTRLNMTLHDWIAAAGGVIVLDGTEGGERAQPARFDRRRMKDDPFGELVTAYFAGFPDVHLRPNHALFDWLKCETRRRGVRGMILLRQVWCDLWHAEVQRFREWLDLPLLDIDLDDTPCDARTQTRLQAFLESLR